MGELSPAVCLSGRFSVQIQGVPSESCNVDKNVGCMRAAYPSDLYPFYLAIELIFYSFTFLFVCCFHLFQFD